MVALLPAKGGGGHAAKHASRSPASTLEAGHAATSRVQAGRQAGRHRHTGLPAIIIGHLPGATALTLECAHGACGARLVQLIVLYTISSNACLCDDAARRECVYYHAVVVDVSLSACLLGTTRALAADLSSSSRVFQGSLCFSAAGGAARAKASHHENQPPTQTWRCSTSTLRLSHQSKFTQRLYCNYHKLPSSPHL